MDLKKKIIKASSEVRKKYDAFKKGVVDEEEIYKKRLKPIFEPIQEIAKTIKKKKSKSKKEKSKNSDHDKTLLIPSRKQTGQDTYDNVDDDDDVIEYDEEDNAEKKETDDEMTDEHEEEGETIDQYLNKCKRDVKNEMDHTYGVYRGKDGWMIGNSHINFVDNRSRIRVQDKVFEPTKGLLELLFKKKPIQKHITEDDLNQYKDILRLSSAHLVKYTAGEKINGTKIPKYKRIIAKLFKKGAGLVSLNNNNNNYMKVQVSPCTPEYAHYSDINEIVDRYRLLIASGSAGNNSHNNEIINIIDQLKREGIIY